MDFRKKYIVKCLQSLLSLSEQPQQLTTALDEFISHPQECILLMFYRPGKKLKVFTPEQDFPLSANVLMVVVMKMSNEATPATLPESFNISLSTADCLRHLAQHISRVYLPQTQDKSVKAMMTSLASRQLAIDNDESVVNTVAEEFAFWKQQSGARAEYFIKCYSEVQALWLQIDTLQQKELKSIPQLTFAALDEIWDDKYPYNAKRFNNLLRVMSETLWRTMSNLVPSIKKAETDVLRMIEENISTWYKFLEEYRSISWRTKKVQFNESGANELNQIAQVKEVIVLLEEVRVIKETIYVEIDIEEIEELFQKCIPLTLNPLLVSKWQKAKKLFFSILQSKANAIATYLRQKILSVSRARKKPLKVLQEMSKWSALLNMEAIKTKIKHQTSQIAKIIEACTLDIRHQFQSRTGQSFDPLPNKQQMVRVKNFSLFLSGILWTKQAADRVRRLNAPSSQQLLKDFEQYEQEQLNRWKSQIAQCQYSDEGLNLQLKSKMIELDMRTSTLRVNYSDRLILLIREIRQLSELGLKNKIPKDILDAAEQGKLYYKQALCLKKIAAFYNNMGQQIIDVQKAMLLKQLQHFQECVKRVNENKDSTWDNPQSIAPYVQALTKATNRLTKENNRLRGCHEQVLQQITNLINYDMVKNKHVWMSALEQIKEVVEQACGEKEQKYCRKWKLHCDVQLYKVLQLQFGVEQQDNDINVEVVLKNKTLAFKPALEEIKEKYYRSVCNYLMWPAKTFKGILGNLDLYHQIGVHDERVKNIITKAENNFLLLSMHMRGLEQWNSIKYLQIHHSSIKNMQEWEFNIRVIRMKRKELEKIQDIQQIQCFTINHTRFKHAADLFFGEFLQAIMNSLKSTVIEEHAQITSFLEQSLVKLMKKPETVEEIQQIKSTYLQIKGSQRETRRRIDEIVIKKKWILQATGYNHQTEALQELWEQFANKLLDYDHLLAEQLEHLKSIIGTRTKQLESELKKHAAISTTLTLPSTRADVPQVLVSIKFLREGEDKLLRGVEELTKDCEQFQLQLPVLEVQKTDWSVWNVFVEYYESSSTFQSDSFVKMKRFYEYQDVNAAWGDRLRGMDKSRQIVYLLKETEVIRGLGGVYKALLSGVLEKEHWRTFYSSVGSGYIETPTLRDMLNLGRNIQEKQKEVGELLSRAQGQAVIRDALQELAIWWETAEFEMLHYEGKKNKCYLIREWKEMTSKVSDNISLVQSLKESRWVGRFLQQILSYENRIALVERALYSLNTIQRKWIYLEPILVNGALPEQLNRFNRLDAEFRKIMEYIGHKPKLQTICDIQGLDASLQQISEEEEKCQKALNLFLEVKRSKFPRFYFLGDEDLLQILAQTQNHSVIQLHMKKLFAAIHTVEFAGNTIVEILSVEKQRVALINKVKLTQNVEDWLNQLEKSMFHTLQSLLKQYIQSKTTELKLSDYPSQILCVMQEIRFSSQLQNSIKSKNLSGLQSKLRQDLLNLTKILPTVSRLQGVKLKAIILDLIHHLNIVSQLNSEGASLSSYNYRKNYCFTGLGEIRLFTYKYNYTFEYQGNLPKLVHTPLTDKCYITLSLALSLGLGGNPYGPAGTGKTETVKAMAMLFGRMCLVFNCDEGLDYKSMARIFLGLVRCGAWGCFDEFNRLLQEQLSAISQQIQVIQFAIKANHSHLELIGKKIAVNPNSGIFVTLNPAGKGYGGRSRLPDNLKQLFRPVAMSVPDNELIAEVLLYSEGFKEAKQLATKVICLFTLSKQLLSQQQHYDWGLRALKTILSVAGRLIFQERKINPNVLFQTECELVIKAIRVNTLSKLTFTDMRQFKCVLQDIFPGIASKDIAYKEIEEGILLAMEEMGLVRNQAQVTKILQFYQATQQRMGVVLVGPSGCGKTTIWKVLKRAYEKMGRALKTYLMNPKSMPRQQLLGQMNNDTREFSEGVLTVSARELVKNVCANWVILDGDIDPEWVESLNSVLDDNHLLTLPTGERINFQTGTCFIFETDSLLYASPATVSRMGMIYLNTEDINIDGIIEKCPYTHLISYLKDLLPLLNYAEVVQTTIVGQIYQVLSQMHAVSTIPEFICASARAILANYQGDQLTIFNALFHLFKEKNPFKQPLNFYAQGNKFHNYTTAIHQFTLQQVLSNSATLRTATAQSNIAILKQWVQNNNNFIVVGPQGCGKAMLIRQAYSQIRKQYKINFATIYCNSQSNAQHVIQKLYQVCSKSNSGSGKILRPKDCTRQVIYLKDINLPKPDKYMTIQLASFLQQIISHKGFYDPTTLQFVVMDDKIQIIASMFPPSAIGRNQLTPRLTAVMKVLNVEYPSNEDLTLIYVEYFKPLLHAHSLDQHLAKSLASLLIDIYTTIKKTFTVDHHKHYSLTPKSLYNIFKNLHSYSFTTMQGLLDALVYEMRNNYRNKVVGMENKNKFQSIVIGIIKSSMKMQPKFDAFYSWFTNAFVKIKKEDYIQEVKQAVTVFSRQYREINFCYIEEAISILSSLVKVLRDAGNVLLVGVSGVGRQTYLLISAIMLKMEVHRLTSPRQYTVREFKKQLKSILEKVITENKKSILFVEDYNLSKGQFIQILNSLMTSGEVLGLFSGEQLERVAGDIKNQYIGKSLQQSCAQRIQTNLRIVISLDPRKDNFNETCASNPALFLSNVLWIDNLQSPSLQSILLDRLPREVSQEIAPLMSEMHKSMQSKSKAPQRYAYALCDTFIQIYGRKSESKIKQGEHLQKGLQKLQQAKKLVDELSKEAYEKQKQLEVKQTEATKAMGEIQLAVGEATRMIKEKEGLSKELQGEEEKMIKKKSSVEADLAEVQPMIEQAKKAVQGISSANLSELASLNKPPEAVRVVMGCIVKIFGEMSGEWATVKNFIKNKSFIDNILTFQPRKMHAELRKDMEKEVAKNSNYFEKEVIYRASLAAGPLADWTKAMLKYSAVVQSIKPLENQLNQLLKGLQSSKKRVLQCENERIKIDEKVNQLKSIFAAKTAEGEVLKNQLKKSQITLNTAKNLLTKLEDERARWENEYKNIERQIKQYPINSLLASCFLTYLSNKDQNERQQIVKEWKVRYKNESFGFLKFMIEESVQLKWRNLGLPYDLLSLENSAMVLYTSKTPLLMDPNSQAIIWLKKSQPKLECISQNNPKLTNALELAVRFGKQLLIEELESIEGILIHILKGDTEQDGSRVVVRVGDKTLDYNKEFKLYLATRNSNMTLTADTLPTVTLINYTVTKSGLESKLLSIVINSEQPELEKKKTELLQSEDLLKSNLEQLEVALLTELANSKGNILENKTLLDNLTDTKEKSITIGDSLKQSERLNLKLDTSREIYRSLAKKGAQLYLLISQLHKINHMYRFSLSYFTTLFLTCLKSQSLIAKDITEKLKQAQNYLNRIVFHNVSNSLFKADRLGFGLHLIHHMGSDINDAEWNFFTGSTPLPVENKVVLPKWSTFDRQQTFNYFCVALPKLGKSINFNDSQFEQWFLAEQPQKHMPNCLSKLTKFEQILIVKVFRPQRLQPALINFLCESLGISNMSGSNQTMKQIVEKETSCNIPALFIVSTGYDPSKELEEFCEAQVGRDNYLQLSMGGGQNQLALETMRTAAEKGQWVCFKNLHLVTAWLPTLEKQFKALQARHQNFRVFLTSQQHSNFPNIMLETCFKVSYESPPGVKKNFIRTYQQLQTNNNPLKTSFTMILAYFHALVQERRNYIPQGWSKSYQFSYSDLKVALQIINNIVAQYETTKNINFQTLYGIFEEGIYGGRIDNVSDLKVLRAYLRKYFNLLVLNNQSPLALEHTTPRNHKQFQQFLSVLPQIDEPSLFGLGKKMDKAVQRSNAWYVMESLKQLSVISLVEENKAKQLQELNPLIVLWTQVYKQIKESKYPQIKSVQLLSEDPLESFIYLQAAQALDLTEKINKQIEALDSVVQGKGLMTAEIFTFVKVVQDKAMPKLFQQFWSEAEDAFDWIRKFARKILLIKAWVIKAQNNRLRDEEFDLAQLFHPGVFINACKQRACRNKIALDKLNMIATFEQNKATNQAIRLKNLLLQGCSLMKYLLGPSSQNDVQEEILPTLYLDFLPNSPPLYSNEEEFCLFSSLKRDNLLIKLKLGVVGENSEKIIAGTALMLRDI